MPKHRFDPEDLNRISGEVPPGVENGFLHEPTRDNFLDRRATANRLLPEDDELIAMVDGKTFAADSIFLKLGHKAHEYTLKIAHKGNENKKAVLAITITGAGLYLITKSLHTRPKKKS